MPVPHKDRHHGLMVWPPVTKSLIINYFSANE
jgi:hypothetical protein